MSDKIREVLQGMLEWFEHVDHRDGYCCCGMRMSTHERPEDCGHVPLDAGVYHAGLMMAEARAALAQQPAQAVLEGWKLVPIEPTREMLAATSWPGCAGADYAKMIAAAPPAAEQPDAWTPSGAGYDRNIHRNPHAAAWADLFVATFPGLADKRDLMLGWFANAMMAMHDHLKAQQPDTVAVPRELYTCIGKGGTYELIGRSQGAGELKHQQLVVYRSGETGRLYHRTPGDFDLRMTPMAGGEE